MILFLDFDGVLHPIPAGNQGVFCHLARLQNLLQAHPILQVVVSSSWRESFSWPEIKGFFDEELQQKIIDKTPVISGGTRYQEIQAWLIASNYQGEWLALDDNPAEFPFGCPQLCLCDTTVGFDEAAERKLVAMLIDAYRRLVSR